MLSEIIKVFLLAMTPVGELRAAIPVGLAVYHLNWLVVYFTAIAGNLAVTVLLLLILKPLSTALSKRTKWGKKFFAWLFGKGQQRAAKLPNKQSTYWALAAFVAVPLPATGAWTGSLVAFVLGLPFKKSLLAIGAGIFAAGIIVTIAAKTGIAIEKYFGWQALLVILLFVGATLRIFSYVKSRSIQKISA